MKTSTMNQSKIIERTEKICNEFDGRAADVGIKIARLELAKAFAEQEASHLDGTAGKDRHNICKMGRLFWGDSKQCYSGDAVYRKVKTLCGGVKTQPGNLSACPVGGEHKWIINPGHGSTCEKCRKWTV